MDYYVSILHLHKMQNERISEILDTLGKRRSENRLNYYKPYKFQVNFHESGRDANQRLLMAANRVGKSYVGAMEMAIHLTGQYPDWWKGKKFDKPIKPIDAPPFPSAPTYDAKAWPFLKEFAKPNALFWNVGK